MTRIALIRMHDPGPGFPIDTKEAPSCGIEALRVHAAALSRENESLKSRVDELTSAHADLKDFLGAAQLAVIVVDGDMVIRHFTDAAARLFALRPGDCGRALGDICSPPLDGRCLDLARRVARTGEKLDHRVSDNQRGRDYAVRILPCKRLAGATLVFTDITDALSPERDLLRERDLHLAEVNHRIKNLFAVVSAMISSVERESADTQEFSHNLRGRISALDRAHALMLRDDMRAPIPLDQLLARVLEPSRGGQTITVEGTDTLIPVRELTPLVLILHEWTTNSAKYGALSGPEGALTIRWANEEGQFRLRWEETATEVAGNTPTSGFGSQLVSASIQQLHGEMAREVSGGLLRLTLTMPAFPGP